MLVRSEPERAPLCPECGDAMRLARKLPPVRSLSRLVVHLCGRCGYVGASEREPERPAPKWLQPKRGSRYSKQLRAETGVPIPMKLGRAARCDYE